MPNKACAGHFLGGNMPLAVYQVASTSFSIQHFSFYLYKK